MKRLLRHITEFQMAFLLLTRLPAGRLAGNRLSWLLAWPSLWPELLWDADRRQL